MPNFKTFTDDEVRASYTLTQRLIYAYDRDKEITKTLEKIHKDLMNERSVRKINESAENRNICGEILTSETKKESPPKVDGNNILTVPNVKPFSSRLFKKSKI